MSDYERLSETFRYEPLSGLIFWKVFTHGAGGKIAPGDAAGTPSSDGRPGNVYLRISVGYMGRTYSAHRLAWLLMTGGWPPKGFDIDHIDRDPLNNAWLNLRLLPRGQNVLNAGARQDNTSGCRGVAKARRTRWQAYISVDKRRLALGEFATFDEAVAARRAAEKQYFPNLY